VIDLPDEEPPHRDEDAPSNVVPFPRRRRASLPTTTPDDIAIADEVFSRCGEHLRYCGSRGGWFVWRLSHWEVDVTEQARELVKNVARWYAKQAAENVDEDLFKVAHRVASARGTTAILDVLRSDERVVVRPEAFDADPWLLNCWNGTIDLRRGELRPHRREDLITRVCPTNFDVAAFDAASFNGDHTSSAPRFHRFLAEVQPDAEVRAYLQRLFGYAAVGVVQEHILGVLWGSGANGKSVLMDVVRRVLGDYAKPGPASLIVTNGHHTPHPTDVASLVGSRLVVVHETARGATFDASKVKLLTGGDALTARHMREDFFTFEPTHTLLMLSNYKPSADASDPALWRRVQLVPFGVVVPEDRRDRELADRIVEAEASGVLSWIVRGALEWHRIGLSVPAIVREQTEAYRASEDVVAAFLAERCVVLPAAKVKAGLIYDAFKAWAESQGVRAMSGRDFAAEVIGRGFRRLPRSSSGIFYEGIGLAADGGDDA